jgi:YD repeat-containing protein
LEWSRDGKEVTKKTYVDGKHLAAADGWYTLGQKHFQGCYLHAVDMPESKYDWWTGSISSVPATSTGPDLKHGVWTEWHRNGNKKTEAQYDHGVAVHKFTWWYENGQKQAEVDYQAGVPSGTWTTWHPNGLKESQAEYRNGDLVTQWMHWDADGKLVEVRDPGKTPPVAAKETQTTARQSHAPATRSR